MTEWNALKYSQQSSLQEAMAEEQLGHLEFKGGEHILDVGCGDGKITAKVVARLPRGSALGVDPSHQMIAFASGHFDPAGHPNLHFKVADVRSMTYRNQFDLVISFNALHWVPEQEKALRAILQALKPGGSALLRFVPEGDRKSLEDVIEDTRRSKTWTEYFADYRKPYAHYPPAEYRVMAERAGFRVVRIELMDRAWDFKTREAFAGFCQVTFVEWTRLIPESRRATFIEDVLNRYQSETAQSPDDNHTFRFYQMLVVLASQEKSGSL